MSQILLIQDGQGSLHAIDSRLRAAGHQVIHASTRYEALSLLPGQSFDLIISGTHSIDIGDLRALRAFCESHGSVPLVLLPEPYNAADAVVAIVAERSWDARDKHGSDCRAPQEAGSVPHARSDMEALRTEPSELRGPEAHAAARWAHAVVPIVGSPNDLRTVQKWSRWIAVSPGAVRNWCRTAGIGTRRSLVFGRLLRAVMLSDHGRHKPENLLDIVDRRTLIGLLALAGFDAGASFPQNVGEFIERQRLLSDRAAIAQIRCALAERQVAGIHSLGRAR